MVIATIIGARPQFIKASMVSRAIAFHNASLSRDQGAMADPKSSVSAHRPSPITSRPSRIAHRPLPMASSPSPLAEILIHTGQHYDFNMSDIFFQELGIRQPDYHLGVGSGDHGEQTGEMLKRIEEVLKKTNPDFVIVYGDTNSTLAGALAAAKLHIPVAYVEAGLRSFNKKMPEEINRVLTDHCSTILFCPTKVAVQNLKNEGFTNILANGELFCADSLPPTPYALRLTPNDHLVINVGDVMFDLLKQSLPIAAKSQVLDRLSLKPKNYKVLTLHRAENVDDFNKLKELIDFVSSLDAQNIVFPVHPRTKKTLLSLSRLPQNLLTIEPVGYFDMLKLMMNASMILTDSGGVQKEAYWLKVPCITLREETEWTETIESGWNVLYKKYNGKHPIKSYNNNQYGDGHAAERIVQMLRQAIGDGQWALGDKWERKGLRN